jgi:hypothetical protein
MNTTLQFRTILELVDFQMLTATPQLKINTLRLTLTGDFSEADIELAKADYKAEVISTEKGKG